MKCQHSLANVSLGWAKSDNWRIADYMTQEDLEGTDLGEFLKDLWQGNPLKRMY